MDTYGTWTIICMEIMVDDSQVFRRTDWFNDPMIIIGLQSKPGSLTNLACINLDNWTFEKKKNIFFTYGAKC